MITVHHLENSRSQRILWLLEELGLPYEVVPHARDPATRRAPEALRAVHPLGKAPILVATDGAVLAESAVIVEWLLDRHPEAGLRPVQDSEDFARYRYWLHYAEGSGMPNLLLRAVFDGVEAAPLPFLVRHVARAVARGVKRAVVAPQLGLHLAHMQAALVDAPWFAGETFSGADIMMSFPAQAAASLGLVPAGSRLADWLARIEARDAWRRAIARGGPFAM
jgi:glutathione S-transferase